MEYNECNEEEKRIWDYLTKKYKLNEGEIIISAEEVMKEMIGYKRESSLVCPNCAKFLYKYGDEYKCKNCDGEFEKK